MRCIKPLWVTLTIVLGLAACSPQTTETPPDADSDRTGDGDNTPGDGDIPSRCNGRSASLPVGTAQRLESLVESQSHCLLYGIDPSGSEVYFIDLDTDEVRHTIAVGSQPTDLVLTAAQDELVVAVYGEQRIVSLDAVTGAVLQDVSTEKPPFRLARGPGRQVFYVEEDVFSAIYQVSLVDGVETARTGIDFHEPDLESSADGFDLYLGEANLPGSRLFKFDATATDLSPALDTYRFDGGFTLPSPERRIHFSEAGGRVFFADRSFESAALPRMRGWIGAQVLSASPDGAILATAEQIHDGETFVRFANRPHPGVGVLFSGDGKWIYEFDALGSRLYRTAVASLVGVHRLGDTNVPAGSLAQHNLSQLLCDPNRPIIYALDAQQNQLIFIDRDTLLPTRAEIIGSAPTDMSIFPDGDTMAVATFGATEIALIDLAATTKALKSRLPVPGNPFKVVAGLGDRLVFAEQDQYSAVTLVSSVDATVFDSLTDQMFQPDVELDPTGRYLFAGEAAGPEARLFKLDLENGFLDEVAVTSETYAYPARRVIYNGGWVYYASRRFSAADLTVDETYEDAVIAVSPDGQYAVSRRFVFATEDGAILTGLPIESDLVAIDPDGTVVYQFDNATGALFVQPLGNG